MTLLTDFKARFPNFDDTIADTYIPILEDVYPCYWGGNYDTDCGKEIVLNLLAHLVLQESQSATDSAPLKSSDSKSIGSVSVSYANPTTTMTERNSWLRSTCYGVRYLLLTSRSQGGYFV